MLETTSFTRLRLVQWKSKLFWVTWGKCSLRECVCLKSLTYISSTCGVHEYTMCTSSNQSIVHSFATSENLKPMAYSYLLIWTLLVHFRFYFHLIFSHWTKNNKKKKALQKPLLKEGNRILQDRYLALKISVDICVS